MKGWEEREFLKKKYEDEGKTPQEIAYAYEKKTGKEISADTVRSVLKKMGVKMRGARKAMKDFVKKQYAMQNQRQ